MYFNKALELSLAKLKNCCQILSNWLFHLVASFSVYVLVEVAHLSVINYPWIPEKQQVFTM
jgi:hypothetical protein